MLFVVQLCNNWGIISESSSIWVQLFSSLSIKNWYSTFIRSCEIIRVTQYKVGYIQLFGSLSIILKIIQHFLVDIGNLSNSLFCKYGWIWKYRLTTYLLLIRMFCCLIIMFQNNGQTNSLNQFDIIRKLIPISIYIFTVCFTISNYFYNLIIFTHI